MPPALHYLRLYAPAKVNLGLRILGRDPAGYHMLETVFHTIAIADHIHLRWDPSASPHSELTCTDPSLDLGPGNSARRALECLRRLGAPLGHIHCHLDKGIPVGGGLGGSSADAAAILRGLRHLLPATVSQATLDREALALGADVPFLIRGGCAHGLGRGEILSPLPHLHGQPLWLLIPDFSCATPAAFAALSDRERAARSAHGCAWWREGLSAMDATVLDNALWPAACRIQPQLHAIAHWLEQQGQTWAMSGSGSVCYLLGPAREAPPPGLRLIATHFLGPDY